MHPMKSVWSISQTVDKEIVLQKTNKHTCSCLPQSSWWNSNCVGTLGAHRVCLGQCAAEIEKIRVQSVYCSFDCLMRTEFCQWLGCAHGLPLPELFPCWKWEWHCASANLLWQPLLVRAQPQPSGIPAVLPRNAMAFLLPYNTATKGGRCKLKPAWNLGEFWNWNFQSKEVPSVLRCVLPLLLNANTRNAVFKSYNLFFNALMKMLTTLLVYYIEQKYWLYPALAT